MTWGDPDGFSLLDPWKVARSKILGEEGKVFATILVCRVLLLFLKIEPLLDDGSLLSMNSCSLT